MSYMPDEGGRLDVDVERARAKTNAPGLFLIVVGVLNLLGALGWLGFAYVMTTPTGAQALDQALQQNPEYRKQLEDAGMSKEDLLKTYQTMFGVSGGVTFLASLLTIFGGARMRSLRSYGLAVLGAVVAAIPWVSSTGFCCLGEIAGIWAIVVLLNSDVRAGFSAVSANR
jgi:hypothetical protein